jgi:hypothetical protein
MNKVLAALVAALTVVAVLVPAAGASAADLAQARGAKNTWMTKTIRQRIVRAGDRGVSMTTVHRWARAQRTLAQDEQPADVCATSDPSTADVYAGACQVYPYSCTMNFIYKKGGGAAAPVSDGRNYFIGTAGHCVKHANQPVFIQNDGRYVHVGWVDKFVRGPGNSDTALGAGGIGNDFASVQIAAGRSIDPRSPVGGPRGIYTGCEPRAIKFYGHGYVFAVGQGQPGAGLAHLWFDRSFAWAGDGLPGDSGSGVLTDDNRAGGILTHLNIDPDRYPGATHAGTRVTRALTFLGGLYHLVNEDYTTSRADMSDTACGNADSGNGGETAAATRLLG